MNETQAFLKAAASVRPSSRQMAWFDTEFYAFIHFSPNTYTGLEWGRGDEDPALFNPTDLDCDEWVSAVKSAGMRGLILTAKHHDGFCLWPSRYTSHSIKSSPFMNGQGDIVRAAAEACRRGGIKFGFYLSPWDRNCPLYGTPAYNDYYCAQLTELLTQYGDIFMVWFDGACGEGPDGKKQVYDFARYIQLVRQYQPNACIFNDRGPDVRWCGNESGTARYAEWAVVPSELCSFAAIQTDCGPLAGDLSHMENTDSEIGSLDHILYSRGLVFAGSEIDMSIRPGWFYHPDEEPHSLNRLLHTYLTSVGGNACFNLNVPPMPSGRLDPRDIRRLDELGRTLQDRFARPLAVSVEQATVPGSDTQAAWLLQIDRKQQVRTIVLAEDISQGQRVSAFKLQMWDPSGRWLTFAQGTCIGHKKICQVDIETDRIRLLVTAARDTVHLSDISLYG